jgi:ubiquinone/menaquinone biosynthesis C-methylase UbiE
MRLDYSTITEMPRSSLNAEQWERLHHRYGVACKWAVGRRVLEVACGAGLGLNALDRTADGVVGCDYSWSGLATAQEHGGRNVPLLQCDGHYLAFATGSFDLVLLFEALYYMAHPEWFVNECRRVLASKGRLLVASTNPAWPYFYPGKLSVGYQDSEELRSLLMEAGFVDIEIFGAFAVREYGLRRQLVAGLRQQLLRSGLGDWLQSVMGPLQRLSYGQLHPLPASIEARAISESELEPVAAGRVDRLHKVLYATGRMEKLV